MHDYWLAIPYVAVEVTKAVKVVNSAAESKAATEELLDLFYYC